IDDDSASLDLLVDTLSVHGYNVCPAQNAQAGLQLAKSQPFDLFMIDVMMPGMSGYDLCKLLKEDHALRPIPVIFVSAVGDTQVKVNGFKAGGVDYVTKPYHRDELLAR